MIIDSFPVNYLHEGEGQSVYVTTMRDENNQSFIAAETPCGSYFEFTCSCGRDGILRFYYRGTFLSTDTLDNLGHAYVDAFIEVNFTNALKHE